MTHWLNHSLVLAADFRVEDVARVRLALERREGALAGLGAHHALIYESTAEPGRVLVMIAIHARDPLLELIRSRSIFEWFDAMGVMDIPAVFAGELAERVATGNHLRPAAPEVMVSIVTPIDDLAVLLAHVHDTVDRLGTAGVRTVLTFNAFDNPHEVMMLLQIDEEQHAHSWLNHSELAAEWLETAGFGAYPPVFVGRFRGTVRVD